jgi:phosphate transport system protein
MPAAAAAAAAAAPRASQRLPHMKKFDQELASLRSRVVEMGQVALSMVEMAIAAMTDLDAVYPRVLQAEDRLDRMELDIDHECVRLLTVYSPVAANLRFVLATSHVNNALERIGDQAVGLCHTIDFAGHHVAAGGEALPKLKQMGEIVQGMIRDAILAFADENAVLAESTIAQDDAADALNDQIMRETLGGPDRRENGVPRDVSAALTQILIARSLERFGDQATNVCEEVIYMVQGWDVRHSHKHPPHRTTKAG